MKYFLSLLSLSTIFFFSSCELLLESTGSHTAQHSQKPDFLENVVVNGNSSSVQTKKECSSYSLDFGRKSHSIADCKITLDRNVMTGDSSLARFIGEWMGVPYLYGGLTKKGIDCSAFTRKLYDEVYQKHILRTAFDQFNASIPIYNPDELKEGDLVFFKIKKRYISHVGVYLSDGYFVQASSTNGVIISSLDDNYWKRYFFAGGRISS